MTKESNLYKTNGEPYRVSIVYNLVDHLSLTAAVLLAKSIEENTLTKVECVEMADVFDSESQYYVWVGCGVDVLNRFKEYYLSGQPASKKSLEYILSRSRVLDESVIKDEFGGFTSVIMDAYYFLLEERVIGPTALYTLLFERFEKLGKTWNSKVCKEEDLAVYSECLEIFHKVMRTWDFLSITTIFQLSVSSPEKTDEYKKGLSMVSSSFVSRFRAIKIVNTEYQYVTTTSPEVYAVLRRIGITGNDFLHFRQGSYGSITYSSTKVPDKSYSANGVIALIPCPI